nr:hypothetical protein [uncultured Devosia sp.]
MAGTYGPIWWTTDLAAVFHPEEPDQLSGRLASIALISEIIAADAGWNRDNASRAAYRTARYWLKSGKWDLILAALHFSGDTSRWPTSSARWSPEPFNHFGFPNTGFLTIVSLRQADLYRRGGGPSTSAPFPLQKLDQLSRKWRDVVQTGTAMSVSLQTG